MGKLLRKVVSANFLVRGFTLLEVLIVISMMAIMTAVLLVPLSGQRTKKEVAAAAVEVAAAVREAQNCALSGKQIDPQKYPCRFTFQRIDSVTYSLSYYYHTLGGDCSPPELGPEEYTRYSLKNGVQFNNSPNFSFSLPHAVVSPTGILPIALKKGTTNWRVCVYPSGRVREIDGTTCPTN